MYFIDSKFCMQCDSNEKLGDKFGNVKAWS